MKRIGLILNCIPHAGGSFQYTEMIIESLEYIRTKSSDIEIVAVFENGLWNKYLDKYNFKKIKTDLSLEELSINVQHIWLARYLLNWTHKGIREMIKESCNIWICPSQDYFATVLKAPTIIIIHDLMHKYEGRFSEVYENGEYERRENLFYNASKYAKKIIVDSKCGKQHVKECYNIKDSKIKILPFIAPNYITQSSIYNIRDIYGIEGDYIFYPAQFWEHKNHNNLLRAIAILKQDIKDIKLILSGSKKNNYYNVINLIDRLGLNENVQILGYVPNEHMRSLYINSRGLVMPTYFGPTNIPPLEAMELECPMAISNIYGMPEQMEDAALYFHPDSVEEIAASIKKMWCDKKVRETLKENCRELKKKHSKSEFNQVFFDIINEAIKK